jgi:hypothetical protein
MRQLVVVILFCPQGGFNYTGGNRQFLPVLCFLISVHSPSSAWTVISVVYLFTLSLFLLFVFLFSSVAAPFVVSVVYFLVCTYCRFLSLNEGQYSTPAMFFKKIFFESPVEWKEPKKRLLWCCGAGILFSSTPPLVALTFTTILSSFLPRLSYPLLSLAHLPPCLRWMLLISFLPS